MRRAEHGAASPPPGGEGQGVRVPGAAWPESTTGKQCSLAGSRLKLLLLLALFATPALAAWLTHHVWTPAGGGSYGQLLTPRIPDLPGLDALRGRWVLLTAADGACAADCQGLVRLTRQVRLAQGRERERVARAVLADNAPALADEPGLARYALPAGGLRRLHADGAPGIYLLDPRGRVMLRFPPQPDGKAMIRDLRTLLAASSYKDSRASDSGRSSSPHAGERLGERGRSWPGGGLSSTASAHQP